MLRPFTSFKRHEIWLRLAGAGLVLLALQVQPLPLPFLNTKLQADEAFQNEDYALAAQRYHAAMVYMPWQSDLLSLAAQAELQAGDMDAVFADLTTLQATRPLTPEEHLLMGHILASQGNLAAAEIEWQIAIEANVAGADAYLQLVDYYAGREDWTAVARYLSALVEQNPNDAAAHYRLGLVLMLRDAPQAGFHLETAATLEPDLNNKVALLTGLLADHSTLDPAFYWAQMGILFLELEEWPLAEAALGKAALINPLYGEAIAYLGYARAQRGDVRQALPALQQAAAVSPDSPVVFYLTGLYWAQQQSWPEARTAFERAYDLDLDNPGLAVEIANTHRAENQLQWAEIWMLEAVRLAGNDERILIALAQFYVESDYQVETKGLAAARKAVAVAPDNGAAHDVLGWTYFLVGDLAAAEDEIQEAILLDPSLAIAYFHLGSMREFQARNAEAAEYYDSAVRLDPGGAIGIRAQRALERMQAAG